MYFDTLELVACINNRRLPQPIVKTLPVELELAEYKAQHSRP